MQYEYDHPELAWRCPIHSPQALKSNTLSGRLIIIIIMINFIETRLHNTIGIIMKSVDTLVNRLASNFVTF